MPKKLSKTDTKKLTETEKLTETDTKKLSKTHIVFTKQLSEIDIKSQSRLSFPMKSLEALAIRKEIGVTDTPTRKPVLSSGWTEFAKERGHKKKDEVTFFVMDDINGAEDLEFQIQARKRMELFGKVFWTAPK